LAQQEQIRLVDDLDGSPAATIVTFGLDWQTYELDLSDDHAAELRELFVPYVEAGRRSRSEGRRPSRRSTARAARTSSPIRAWAEQQGLTVSRRGRIPDHIRRAYAERDVTARPQFGTAAARAREWPPGTHLAAGDRPVHRDRGQLTPVESVYESTSTMEARRRPSGRNRRAPRP